MYNNCFLRHYATGVVVCCRVLKINIKVITQLLNLLFKKVANLMKLDTSSNRTLWKDRALVEVNIAVLHSFQVMHQFASIHINSL